VARAAPYQDHPGWIRPYRSTWPGRRPFRPRGGRPWSFLFQDPMPQDKTPNHDPKPQKNQTAPQVRRTRRGAGGRFQDSPE